MYSVEADTATASYKFGSEGSLDLPYALLANKVAPSKLQVSNADCEAISHTLWAWLKLKLSLSPTAAASEDGCDGMADQKAGAVPMVTVVVAAARALGDESSSAV